MNNNNNTNKNINIPFESNECKRNKILSVLSKEVSEHSEYIINILKHNFIILN